VASKTQIANMALGRIGVKQLINNVETERSQAAINVRTFFDDDVAYVLRDFPWPWARTYVNLALVGGTSTVAVNNDWQYSYRYPSDCVFARRLVVETVGRQNANPPPFKLGRDTQGRLIFTDEVDAQLEYTVLITDPAEFDAIFVSMLAWKLGSNLAPSMSRVKDMAETCMAMYEIDKTKAEAIALNEGQQDLPLESEFVRARDE
jgi:hypothetical protein